MSQLITNQYYYTCSARVGVHCAECCVSANSCDCLSKLIVFTLFIGIMAPSLAGPSAGGQRSLTGSGYSRRRHKPSIAAIICFWFIYIWYLNQFLLRIINFKEHIYLINQHIYPISRHFLETSWRFPFTDHWTRMEWCWLLHQSEDRMATNGQ